MAHSSTFVVTPELVGKVPSFRFPLAPLGEALGKRLASGKWLRYAGQGRSADSEHDDDPSKLSREVIHVADGDQSICYPHITELNLGKVEEEARRGLPMEDYHDGDDERSPESVFATMQHGFILSVSQAWCHHYPLVLKPDHIWLLVVQGIARHISSAPERFRSRVLSRSASTTGKMVLEVYENPEERFLPPEATDHGEQVKLLIGEFSKLAGRRLSQRAKSITATEFSTSTDTDRVVSSIAVLDICKHFMDFHFIGFCGFPYVRLLGTADDWTNLLGWAQEAIEDLCEHDFATFWLRALLPTLERVVSSYGEEDADEVFWNAMVKRCGVHGWYNPECGFNGWFHVFFPLDADGCRNKFCVAYDPAAQYVRHGRSELWYGGERESEDDQGGWQNCNDFPSGLSKVPIHAFSVCSREQGANWDLELFGGFVGYTQDEESGELMPVTSWFAVEAPATGQRNGAVAADGDSSMLPRSDRAGAQLPKHWVTRHVHENLKVVPVDPGSSVWDILQKCTEPSCPEWLGTGRDYPAGTNWGHPYSQLQLAAAWRVENANLWAKFSAESAQVMYDLSSRGVPAAELAGVGAGTVLGSLPHALSRSSGETFLLHGTKAVNLLPILRTGFNERLCSRGYFGHGIYFATDAGKADQYVDHQGDWCHDESCTLHDMLYTGTGVQHPGCVHYMILARVVRGCSACSHDGDCTYGGAAVWLGTSSKGKTGGGKQHKRELANIPDVDPPLRFHSLTVEPGKKGGKKGARKGGQKQVSRYTEVVVTHSEQCYPEYVLALWRS